MNYENSNPCNSEWYAKAISWAETGCWCCTATRALLVGLWLGITIGLLCAGRYGLSLTVFIAGAVLVAGLLYIARVVWAESYKADTEEPPK